MAGMKFRIEPDLMYCPQCRDEYRAGMERCVECSVELMSGSRMLALQDERDAGRSMTISPDEELADILKGQIINVKNIQALLKSEGVPSIIAGDSASCGKGCCGPEVLLRVRAADLQAALQVLAAEHSRSTGLFDHDTSYVGSVYDSNATQTTCPACGCSFAAGPGSCPDCGLCF